MIHGIVKGGIGFSFAYHGVKNTMITTTDTLTVEAVNRLAMISIAAGVGVAGICMFIL